MKRTHLGVQAAIVLTMVALVSWPEFRPVRAQSVWRYVPSAVVQARTSDGKTTREAVRCLKRYLARHLYRLIQTAPIAT